MARAVLAHDRMSTSRLVTTLGLSLLSSLAACSSESDEPGGGDCLPGDIECNERIGPDGRADGWDYKNNPADFATALNYKLAELPKKGFLNRAVWRDRYPMASEDVAVAWADTYWPTAAGSHNIRWQGSTVKSPLEKYDQAFNGAAGCDTMPASVCGPMAKAAWDAYNECAGPAAKWQSANYQDASVMHNGIDDNGKDGADECNGSDGNDGIATWWGTCHAWSPAALMEPEPQKSVTINGVTFTVGDIKALTQNLYDQADAVMLGGRCNAQEIRHTVTGSANDECSDVNPGSLHVVLTNFLGIAQLPLIEDRTANFEVWNQPMLGYEISMQDKVDATRANSCVGSMGDRWTYNEQAAELYEVRVTTTYLSESHASNTPHGWQNNTSTDTYHYILEINSSGKVIGGRYCSDSTNNHVDFLWSPTGSTSPSNPHVDADKVRELLSKSVHD